MTPKPTKEELEAMYREPANWRYNIFYYNKNDKRLLVPKKFGYGWTFNFANPLSIVILFVLLVGPMIAAVLTLVFV